MLPSDLDSLGPILTVSNASMKRKTQVALWAVLWRCCYERGTHVPWRIAIIMADLPGARQERFTAEETNVLIRAVKDREVILYGDGRNPPKLALVKQAWEETTVASAAGIPRTSYQCRRRYNDIRRRGKSKLAGNKPTCLITGGGSASTQDLTPAEDIAASTLTAESIEGFGGLEIGTQPDTPAVQPQGTQRHRDVS